MKKFLLGVVSTMVMVSVSCALEIKKELVLASEVDWTHLNPARGDLAPSAGTLWGDRNGKVATGYLLKPNDGFQSPPHIHNVSYRAVVIRGLIHNDDPKAEKMWMPAGSFWTQPKGEVHITASIGKDTLAYIEIESGPYLVWPWQQAFDSGERPVNVDPSNLVWLDAHTSKWIEEDKKGVEISHLWGEPKGDNLYGTFIKLPKGFIGKIKCSGDTFKSIVIQGMPKYKGDKKAQTLELGSYFASTGAEASHEIASSMDKETILYVRTNGKYHIDWEK